MEDSRPPRFDSLKARRAVLSGGGLEVFSIFHPKLPKKLKKSNFFHQSAGFRFLYRLGWKSGLVKALNF